MISDTLPHILRVLVDGGKYMPLDELLDEVNIHKLTYFDEIRIARLDSFIKQADELNKSN